MTGPRIPCAILGASGYIGQHFARLLAEHPTFDSPLLVATERSEGRTLGDVWQLAEAPPGSLEEQRLVARSAAMLARDGIQVAFSALPSGTPGPLESELVRRGVSVFSNAADHRMDPRVPLLVPEVNADHLDLLSKRPSRSGILVTNPNCSTTGLVLALAPIQHLVGPRAVHVATYQALSGAGYPGVPSLSIADNVVPFIREEEEKIQRESARILGHWKARTVVPSPVPGPRPLRPGRYPRRTPRSGHGGIDTTTPPCGDRKRVEVVRPLARPEPAHRTDSADRASTPGRPSAAVAGPVGGAPRACSRDGRGRGKDPLGASVSPILRPHAQRGARGRGRFRPQR